MIAASTTRMTLSSTPPYSAPGNSTVTAHKLPRPTRRGDDTFRWVKGHSGDEMNDLVDRLAVEESARAAVS